MLRLAIAIALSFSLSLASADQCRKRGFKYMKAVPEKYAEAALLEYGAATATANIKPTVLSGSSCDGKKILAVLYALPDGTYTYYVGLVVNDYNQMEVKSRGGTTESVAQITKRFSTEAFVLPDMPLE